MVEHGIVPSTTATYDDLSEFFHHIESESDFTTSPIYDEPHQCPCEESHHHMSDMSDSTIYDIECISCERMSVTTTSPTLESMPHILCEVESHLSDSTNHMSESIQEGVSEPQHLVSEVVETTCEATFISNDLASTPSVFSSLVLGLLHDDTPILDESIPPMEKTMAMVDDDAPPHIVPSR